MTEASVQNHTNIVALLCIGEIVHQDSQSVTALTPLFGQPMIHHLIKGLEKVGISKFYLGVDSVPGALLTYRDTVSDDGLDVQFVRDPNALAALMGDEARVLVLRTDTLHDPKFIHRLLLQKHSLVAAVEERAENQTFERIDLNNRWAGVAILERNTLTALSHMPEGWDMASALLRQAIQDGVRLSPVRQEEIQNGNIRKLLTKKDISDSHNIMFGTSMTRASNVEEMILTRPMSRLLPLIWTASWGRTVAHWLFPVFASMSLLLAFSDFALASTVTAIIAILAVGVRESVKVVEYQQGRTDWIGAAGWAILAAALTALLQISRPMVFDAEFLVLALIGLAVLSAWRVKDTGIGFLSPLVIAASIMAGTVFDVTGGVVKLLILFEIGSLLFSRFRQKLSVKAAD